MSNTSWLDDNCHRLVARVQQAWAWLGLLVEPGRESRSMPLLTDAQRTRIAEAVTAERADRTARARPGMPGWMRSRGSSDALASTSAPARLGIVAARAAVHQLVIDAARAAAAALDSVYIGQRADDAAVDDALAWLAGGQPVWVASEISILGRHLPPEILDQLTTDALAEVARLLARADQTARAAAGVEDDTCMPFPHPCPACGRRSLQLNVPGADRRTWTVQCVREACLCTGEGCRCRHAVRYPRRRHFWAYGELDGVWGLWNAIAAARTPPRPVRSATTGHGGWSERRRS